ncbi:hypothetical protein E8E11_006061 [Didymella keratinophila]|nr:hypothetical protein E8E11_006061 [Didymella keratinophila]
MHFEHHTPKLASDVMTSEVVLVVFLVFIAFIITAYFIANWLINRIMHLHERIMHQDLEAFQLTFGEEIHNDYNTFSLSSPEADIHGQETRSRQKRQRLRDHVSEVYQISVSRLDDEISVLNGDSELNCGLVEGAQGQHQVAREEEEDSSESESDSSDDSDSDEVEEMRGLLSMARPLPRRFALLRADVRRVEDYE